LDGKGLVRSRMKNILYNFGYFLKEVRVLLRLNPLSNLLSVLSTGLIFFILATMVSGWWISNDVVEAIQGEAEISVYYSEDAGDETITRLVKNIEGIPGVREVQLIDRDEAYGRMVEILGQEAEVLEYFDANPFSPFIEVKIHVNEMNTILEKLNFVIGIEYVRDNREILEKIQNISEIMKIIGYLIVTAAGISTLVIIAHIIRMGIYDNKEQINTLRLMGAPEAFIAFPFLVEGLVITVAGGMIACLLTTFTINYVFLHMTGPLPFIPLPSPEELISRVMVLVLTLSVVLGVLGSAFGLASAKRD